MTSDTSAPADRQDPGTTSDITEAPESGAAPATRPRRGRAPTPIPERFATVFAEYERDLLRPGSPLDSDTQRGYASRVRQYLAWLDDVRPEDVGGDPLSSPAGRDGAARDYRTYLLTVLKRKPGTVNAHLTAVDDFYLRTGLGRAAVKRQPLPAEAPRAMPARELTRFLRAAERASVRDRAIAFTELYAGLRGGEVAALDVDDVQLSARKGVIRVRYGKGGKYRDVPVHPKLREALEMWIAERRGWPGGDRNHALFLNARGGRLSTRGAYGALASIAEDAGLEVGRDGDFTPHTLRHQAGTAMIRGGTDPVTVAALLGHSLEVVKRYSLPTFEDKQKGIAVIPVDE